MWVKKILGVVYREEWKEDELGYEKGKVKRVVMM